MNKFFQIAICLFFSITIVNAGFSQSVLSGQDLSQVKVDQLSDEEILKYQQQIKSSGLSEAQAEQIALSRGFPASEVAKLRKRVADLAILGSPSQISATAGTRTTASSSTTSEALQPNPRVFGAELFTSTSLTFQPDLKIATPVNYVLGPDDQLSISVYGLQEVAFNLTVSPEGTIYIPNVGLIKVSGETVEAATSKIRGRMSSIGYSSLRSGASRLSVTLGNIRSIRITILGATKPGTYTVSSLSSLFNALYIAGGPALNGSYRQIQLLRDNRVERTVDLYDFLVNGDQSDNVRLRENDVIRIPVYKTRVEIIGEVKRQGIFELLATETVDDLLKYSSGFTDSAYRASIKVIQLTDKERRVKDLFFNDFSNYIPSTGDIFEVSKILNRFQNRVTVAGAVFRPGLFEVTPGLTVGELIRRAEGLREDAYTERGQLIRLQEDLTTEIISFNVREVLQGGVNDIPLRREDQVIISSIFDLRDEFVVSIQGEVRRPGNFKYVDSLTLKDLILQAGGFTDAAYPQRIEIARLIKRDTLTSQDIRLSEIINIKNVNDLSLNRTNLDLRPFDVVTVRRLPGYLELKSVTAIGQLQYPGPYVLSFRSERISDLLKRAGGLTPEAYPAGAYLRRVNEKTITNEIEIAKIDKIQQQLDDSTGRVSASANRPYDQIPLDLNAIMTRPGIDMDLILKAGDELFVPRNDEEIRVSGEVLFPTQSPYDRTDDLKDYINSAGGFTENAKKNKVYVLYPNGKAAKTWHFLFIRRFPEMKPGSEVVVPTKIDKTRDRSTAETALLVSALTSVAGIVIALARLF